MILNFESFINESISSASNLLQDVQNIVESIPLENIFTFSGDNNKVVMTPINDESDSEEDNEIESKELEQLLPWQKMYKVMSENFSLPVLEVANPKFTLTKLGDGTYMLNISADDIDDDDHQTDEHCDDLSSFMSLMCDWFGLSDVETTAVKVYAFVDTVNNTVNCVTDLFNRSIGYKAFQDYKANFKGDVIETQVYTGITDDFVIDTAGILVKDIVSKKYGLSEIDCFSFEDFIDSVC